MFVSYQDCEELEDNIRSAGLGGVDNYDRWSEKLSTATTLQQLVTDNLQCKFRLWCSSDRFCGKFSFMSCLLRINIQMSEISDEKTAYPYMYQAVGSPV